MDECALRIVISEINLTRKQYLATFGNLHFPLEFRTFYKLMILDYYNSILFFL